MDRCSPRRGVYLVIVSRESLEGDVVVEILILVEGQLDLWMKFSILTPGISFLQILKDDAVKVLHSVC